jgi:hypothetical protein
MASKKKEEGPDLEKDAFKEEIILKDAPVITDTTQEGDSWASYKMSMQIGMDTTLRRLLEMLGAGMNITITMIDGKKKKFILVDVEENNKGGC